MASAASVRRPCAPLPQGRIVKLLGELAAGPHCLSPCPLLLQSLVEEGHANCHMFGGATTPLRQFSR